MTTQRNGLYVHVSWLSKMMAGNYHCYWSPWFRARYTAYKKAPSDFQLALWIIEHTQLLTELIKERKGLIETTYVENQNNFKLITPSGLVISGKPDLITVDSDSRYKIYDAKTGQPRESDTIQVMLYMMCISSIPSKYNGKEISGCLVYKNHGRKDIPSTAIGEEFRNSVSYFLNIIQSDTIPEKNPALMECRFCDIGEDDCPERHNPSEAQSDDNIPEIAL
ncbi:PD-(D/E)XK nuclease family protein [Chloroflexota bacterium]